MGSSVCALQLRRHHLQAHRERVRHRGKPSLPCRRPFPGDAAPRTPCFPALRRLQRSTRLRGWRSGSRSRQEITYLVHSQKKTHLVGIGDSWNYHWNCSSLAILRVTNRHGLLKFGTGCCVRLLGTTNLAQAIAVLLRSEVVLQCVILLLRYV